jgi:hypothetical protein
VAAITWDMVTAFAPELATFASGAQDVLLAYVNDALNVNLLDGEDGSKTKLARIYLAAHVATMSKRGGGAAGPVVSSSAGGLSRSFAVIATGGNSSYGATTYGSLYLDLMATTTSRLGFVT